MRSARSPLDTALGRLARLDPAGVELVSAGMALAFAIVWLHPDDTFGRSPAYLQLAAMLPEPAWGLIWGLVGLGQVAGLLGWHARRLTDLVASGLWLFWAVSAYLSTGLTSVQPAYAWLALCLIWASQARRAGGL